MFKVKLSLSKVCHVWLVILYFLHYLLVLTEELEEVKQSSESELNQLRKQLRAATVELQRQRTDMEEQLK